MCSSDLVDFIKDGASAQYDEAVMHEIEKNAEDKSKADKGVGGADPYAGAGDDFDELLPTSSTTSMAAGSSSS